MKPVRVAGLGWRIHISLPILSLVWLTSPELGEPFGRLESHFMLQLQLSSWLVGVLVLAVGILLPLGLAASRNKLLQQAWEKATGKTV